MRRVLVAMIVLSTGCGGGSQAEPDSEMGGESAVAADSSADSARIADSLATAAAQSADPPCLAARLGLSCADP